MMASDRQQQIKELLLEYKHVDVNSLCSFLRVSPATVRRDLDALEKQGFLLKTYGGAVLHSEDPQSEVFLSGVKDPYEAEKKAVAALAVNLVEDGDSIFLGGGELCAMMAKQLCVKSSVNVVTNNIQAFSTLSGLPGICGILVGGQAADAQGVLETVGEISKSTISTLYFDKVFFSVDGISFKHGYSMSALDRLDILQCVFSRAAERILLADSSRFNRAHLHSLGRLDSINRLITSIGTPDDYKTFYLQNKIALYEACME